MATQADILTLTRSRIDESSAVYWSDADLRRWINEATRDVARRTESLRASTTVTVVAGTYEYTPTFTPGQPIRLHRVEYTQTGSTLVYPLQYRDINAADEVWGLHQITTQALPALWTSWNFPPQLKIRLYPVPSIGGTLTIWYFRAPTELATATDASSASTVEIPSGWEDVIVDHVEYKALRRDGDPRWQEAKQEYEQHIADLMIAADRYNDQHGMITSDTGVMIPNWLYAGDGDW